MTEAPKKVESHGIDYVVKVAVGHGINGLADIKNLQEHFISLDNQPSLVESNQIAAKRKAARMERKHKWKSFATRQFRKQHQAIDKSKLTMENIEPITKLWDEYATRIGDGEANVARMDLHGALITVVKSQDPTIVGLHGRVVKESFGSILLMSDDNLIRQINKNHTIIELHSPKGLFEINLSAIRCRPFLRPTKKWKARTPIELPF